MTTVVGALVYQFFKMALKIGFAFLRIGKMFRNTIEASNSNVLDSTDPHYLLDWATSQFEGSLTLATSLGNQTLVIIDMLYRMGRNVPTFCIDTDLLFEETYQLWSEIETRYGMRIERLHSPLSLEDQGTIAGERLWELQPDQN